MEECERACPARFSDGIRLVGFRLAVDLFRLEEIEQSGAVGMRGGDAATAFCFGQGDDVRVGVGGAEYLIETLEDGEVVEVVAHGHGVFFLQVEHGQDKLDAIHFIDAGEDIDEAVGAEKFQFSELVRGKVTGDEVFDGFKHLSTVRVLGNGEGEVADFVETGHRAIVAALHFREAGLIIPGEEFPERFQVGEAVGKGIQLVFAGDFHEVEIAFLHPIVNHAGVLHDKVAELRGGEVLGQILEDGPEATGVDHKVLQW